MRFVPERRALIFAGSSVLQAASKLDGCHRDEQ